MTFEGSICYHIRPSKNLALSYCGVVSVGFVLGLYLFVPASVRSLPRSNTRQIKWRLFATAIVAMTATISYPFLFCSTSAARKNDMFINSYEPVHVYLGWNWDAFRDLTVLLHTIQLFLGPLIVSLSMIPVEANSCLGKKEKGHPILMYISILRTRFQSLFLGGWSRVRDYAAAPLFEEFVFRGLLCSPLLASGLSPTQVVFIAPMFFGTAHIHHAILKLRSGEDPPLVIAQTILQLTYTSLFGMYATYAFIQTGSVMSVTLSHIFCNIMGLPDIGFMHKPSHRSGPLDLSQLYPYRYLLLFSYILGIYLFIQGFTNDIIFDKGNGFKAFFPS